MSSLSRPSLEMVLLMCSFEWGGERFPNPRREHRIWHSRAEAFRGVGRGILSRHRGSFRSGVEGSYLKNFLKTLYVPTNGGKMGFMFAGQTNGPAQGAGAGSLRLLPGEPLAGWFSLQQCWFI